MRIIVNGTAQELAVETLKAALDALGYGDARVATAVNETFVAADAREAHQLQPGDRLEILTPRQGG